MVDQEAAPGRRAAHGTRPRAGAAQAGPSAGPNGSTPSSYLEEDIPKPLYRDEVSDAPTLDLRAAFRSGRTPATADHVLLRGHPDPQMNFAPTAAARRG